MGITSLDELHRTLQRDVHGGRKHQMHMFRHYDESMKLEPSLPPVAVESFQEKSSVRFHNEKSCALPS
jgi:hypothetical protein